MLEIPEAQTVSRQLCQTLKGKTIQSAVAGASPHGFAGYFGDPKGYDALLKGRTIDGCSAYAGQVEISAGEARIAFNDGINIRYLAPDKPVPPKHQLHVAFTDGSSLVCTVSMYGGMEAYLDGQKGGFYYQVAREKPNPLTDNFDKAYFESLLQNVKKNLSAKAFLATEQRIPGLGNGVLQDILWHAHIHPRRKLETLRSAELDAMYSAVKATLREMTDLDGRDTEKDIFGQNGRYQTILSKNTLLFPCPTCGGILVREAYLGGNIYFCDHCQPRSA